MTEEYVLGRHAVVEAMRSGRKVRRLLLAGRGGRRSTVFEEAISLAEGKNIPVHAVREEILDRLGPHHNGIAAEVESYPYVEVSELVESVIGSANPPLIIVLDEVQDPQNFGTLFRTAAALGAHGVVLPRHRSAGITPAVERASAGGVSRLSVAKATNLVRAIEELQKAGIWVYGIDARAPDRYDKTDLTGPIAIVVGSESDGLGRLVKERCDKLIRVPMAGAMESLNVSVAGSIVLAEIFRQREAAGQAVEGELPPEPVKARPAAPRAVEREIEIDEDFVLPERPAAQGDPSRAARPNWSPKSSGQDRRGGPPVRSRDGAARPSSGPRKDSDDRAGRPSRTSGSGPSRGGPPRRSAGPRGAGPSGGFRGGHGGPPKRGPSRPGSGPRRSGGGSRSR